MTHSNKYRLGDSLINCDICGFEYFYSQMKRNSDGLVVCPTDFDPPHPRDNTKESRENNLTFEVE